MPALPPADLPGCCTAPEPLPLLAAELASLSLLHCRFDPAQVSFERDALRLGALPPDNIRRAVAKRQAEYLAGRLCAREALRQLSGTAAVPGHRTTDRGPAWPTGWVGAITHSHGWAAAVVGSARDYQGLGLDVETLLEPAKALRLADQILTPAEQESVQALDEDRQAFAITLAFSAKESLFKALHPQVEQMFFFQDAEILGTDPGGTFDIRLLLDLSPRWSAGTSLRGHFRLDEQQRLLTLVAPRH
ncbi:4'-phosphopantetheinyl transferase family protein [Pseudomonas sp. PLB05]|uniref:4'-phosphopantetheinyl transferase family protein n=1 Tax=Pseudomonas sp. PLB05 TaxID=2899078 RepID=UPI001E32F054|nr:4'-phosphopantetheinyl transferase superfamily protein [Pseudomonas sp. PLB05]MCD4862980.1 4'-phosphopantetheinyl transferase superfamily protein [Pseudomonas sp. PLB05]